MSRPSSRRVKQCLSRRRGRSRSRYLFWSTDLRLSTAPLPQCEGPYGFIHAAVPKCICSFVEYLTDFPQHAGEAPMNCQGQPTSFRKVSQAPSALQVFWTRQIVLLRLNACSQRRFWVALDAILISCTSARFICSPRFLLHNVQPNYEHEDIYHCRHNGWHSSHWLSRYALSISKALQTRLFCDRLEL